MSNKYMSHYFGLSSTEARRLLVKAAKQAVEGEGYELEPHPGRGRSQFWRLNRNSEELLASVRTSRDRWIAFQPWKGGWKTLDDADVVIVAAVDVEDNPENVEVFIFQADEVREKFNASYKARIENNHVVNDTVGMWIYLDLDTRDTPVAVGSGLADIHDPKAVYSVSELISSEPKETVAERRHRHRKRQTQTITLKKMPADDVKMARQCRGICETIQDAGGTCTLDTLLNKLPEFVVSCQDYYRVWCFYKKKLVDDGHITITVNLEQRESRGSRPGEVPGTIAEALSQAAIAIARIAGVDRSRVKLDLKIEN